MPDKKDKLDDVLLEDVRLLFRNFAGEEGDFNAKGKRNFNVALSPDLAKRMEADGWNVKYLQPREEGDDPQAILKVNVSYKGRPPNITLVTVVNGKQRKTRLSESDLGILDWADITKAELIISPYHWEIRGNSGITAYVQTLFVTIRQDELEQKYADVPDSAQSAITREMEDPGEGE